MNYRHAYHAGNFADVVKHWVLTLVIGHLKRKDAPFRVIDTHAGIGQYDLAAGPASRTGEWRNGIGRLVGPGAGAIPAEAKELLEPYLAVVRAFNPPGELVRYPGSPRIARALLRAQDRQVLNELHAADVARLRALFGRDPQCSVMAIDGWRMLKAVLPPMERRAVVLIDPPFEEVGELERMTAALGEALLRFATGVYLLWYPIKDRAPVAAFHQGLVAAGHRRALVAEMTIRSPLAADRLNGCGLVILNPPYLIEEALGPGLGFLSRRLGQDGNGGYFVDWLVCQDNPPA